MLAMFMRTWGAGVGVYYSLAAYINPLLLLLPSIAGMSGSMGPRSLRRRLEVQLRQVQEAGGLGERARVEGEGVSSVRLLNKSTAQ